MTLGTFTPRTRVTGDKIDLRQQAWYGRPMLWRVVEYSDSFKSKNSPNPVEAVWSDVVDLLSGQVLINVLQTSGALVDNLKEYAGTETVLPVKLVKVAGGNFGGYAAFEALDANETQLAQAWYQQNWPMVDAERQRREQASKPAAPAFQQAQGAPIQGFNPQQAAPAQGFQPQAQVPVQPAGGIPQGQVPSPAQAMAQDGIPGQVAVSNAQQAFNQIAQAAPAPAFGQTAPVQQAPFPGNVPAVPAVGQAPAQGMFTDAPAPAGPNAAQAALAALNGQLGS